MDRFAAFTCWVFRGCMGLICLLLVFALWYSTANAQERGKINVKCNEDTCIIAKEDLKALIDANQALAAKLKKDCGIVEI